MTKQYKPLKVGDPWPFESSRGIVGGPCEPAWYALITRPQKERETRHRLQNAGCVVRYPTIDKTRHINGQKRLYTVPIIPRIIYANFKYQPQWDVMKDRRIIVGVFSEGETPLVLSDEKVAEVMGLPETIIRLEDERIESITPKVGGKAQIMDGPFMGFYVDVTKVQAGRVWYEFAFGPGRIKGESGIGSVQRVAE